MKATFVTQHTDGPARVGTVTTPRGTFSTPCFMPVGTRGAVKHLAADDLRALGAEVVLANTYHLMLRPGTETVAALGGLHEFTNWDGHILTDSGGYQVFSLDPKVDDDGALFRSTYDGSEHLLTPELAVEVQGRLGSDIQMVLDVCSALPSTEAVLGAAVDLTARWAARARARFLDDELLCARASQFGIVQGGTSAALRAESAARTVELDFDGYAVGGLSVGEHVAAMLEALSVTTELLPADLPRYFMGLGDPVGIVECVALGVDMFDCVLPTRLARHGTLLTSAGRLNVKRAEFARSDDPIDPDRPGGPAGDYSRGYLRHLYAVGEPTAARLGTLHNLWWLFELMADIRAAIAEGRLATLRADIAAVWADPADS